MKSLKELSLNLPEQEYHDYGAWSYSVIAKYAKEGFSSLATLHEHTAPTPSMEFGSLFDSMLTKGMSTLDEYVIDDTSCPPKEKEVFDWLLSHDHKEPFESISTNDIDFATDACKFYPSYKPDTRYDKLNKASAYYEARRSGKKIVSQNDWDDAVEMARIFRTDPYLKNLFGVKNTDDIEYIYQSQFVTEWDIEGQKILIKIMPDLLVVNHKDKTIQPVDLKTSAMPAYDFAENFLKFHYYLQAETYTDVLKKICETDEDYNSYTVLPYLFTDISRSDKVPVTYIYDPTNGFSFTRNDKTYQYRGWKELLAEILAYEANQAKVPSYITTNEPNDIVSILSMK